MPKCELPDAGDRHVLAAAIEAEADSILTWNLRDFPDFCLTPHGLRAETPDDLLAVLREARLSLKHPPLTAAAYLTILRTQGLSRTCALLESVLAEL